MLVDSSLLQLPMVETDGLSILLINNFYGDDENFNRRKDIWNLDVTALLKILSYHVNHI